MALALSILFDREFSGILAAYDKAKAGRALIREADRLDSAARRKSVNSLSSMLSESQAALIEQLKADGFDPSKMRLPPQMWYAIADGLKTVTALIDFVTANLNDFKQPNPILRDLKAIESVLNEAIPSGAKFHFVKILR